MFQPKDTNWLNGNKNKTHIYAVYKRLTSDLGPHRRLKAREWKKILHANEIKRKLELQYLYHRK